LRKEINCEVCILGSGPAGMAAALELIRNGVTDLIIIDRNSLVGGLARTEVKGDARFDVGPHRFFTKNVEINSLWHDTLKSDFKSVNRLTRIYYNNKYFNYPIKPFDVFSKIGFYESSRVILGFINSKLKNSKEPETFEDWIISKFGKKLYETFFKTYTEKVWGIPCNQIGAEWAAQRIKGLDIYQILKNSLLKPQTNKVKTLVDQFDYPILGAGQMYEAWADEIVDKGGEILLNSRVKTVHIDTNKNILSVDIEDKENCSLNIIAKQYFSSIPITHFFNMLSPLPEEKIKRASQALYYREHITVDLLLDKDEIFPDQWIYIHSPDVQMARIANYNNFSKAMVNYRQKTALSIEYFVFQNDELWKKQDDDIISFALEELKTLNIINKEFVEQAWVVRETESYPTYFLGFREPYEILKYELDFYKNLYPIGRGGMYKYNNQDHSILSGLLSARNYLNPEENNFNLWNINVDAEYLESANRES